MNDKALQEAIKLYNHQLNSSNKGEASITIAVIDRYVSNVHPYHYDNKEFIKELWDGIDT